MITRPLGQRTIFCLCIVLIGTATAVGQDLDRRAAPDFFSALACRQSSIFGGQQNSAAIISNAPGVENILNLIKLGFDPRVPPMLRSIRNATFQGRELSNFIDLHSPTARFYWSPTDDFLAWSGYQLVSFPSEGIRSGVARFEPANWNLDIRPLFVSPYDSMPEHIVLKARYVGMGSERRVIEFNLETRTFSLGDVYVSPEIPLSGNVDLALSSSGRFARFLGDRLRNKHVEVLNSITGKWEAFSEIEFPEESTLLLFRDSPFDGASEAVILRKRADDVDEVTLVRQSASGSNVIASGKFRYVHVSPDRTQVFGVTDYDGQFHRIFDGSNLPELEFWLSNLEQYSGVEKFYVLSGGQFAFVKLGDGIQGSRVLILERRNNKIEEAFSVCSSGSHVGRILTSDEAHLFIPRSESTSDRKLIVYLHGGPFSYVGQDGSWLIDLLASNGNPVLALNYKGSSNRSLNIVDGEDLRETLAFEVERSVIFASQELREVPSIVIVADSFGALVGYSAILSNRISAEGMIVISSVAKSNNIRDAIERLRGQTKVNYLATAEVQTREVLNPARLAEQMGRFPWLVIHGETDQQVPLVDANTLVERYNAAMPTNRAEFVVVQGMGHTPSTKEHYETIIENISKFVHER